MVANTKAFSGFAVDDLEAVNPPRHRASRHTRLCRNSVARSGLSSTIPSMLLVMVIA
jgi:hypothetical protein